MANNPNPGTSYGDISTIFAGSPQAPGVVGGIAIAPIGTTVPNTAFITLDDTSFNGAFRDLGYVTSDGVKIAPKISNDEVVAWGGQTIANLRKSFSLTLKFQLMQTLHDVTNAATFGVSNTSTATIGKGDQWETIVKISNYVNEYFVWVIDSFFNGVHVRDVFPNATVTDIGEIDTRNDQIMHYDLTVSCFPDDNGVYGYSYKGHSKTAISNVLAPDLTNVTFANGLDQLGQAPSGSNTSGTPTPPAAPSGGSVNTVVKPSFTPVN